MVEGPILGWMGSCSLVLLQALPGHVVSADAFDYAAVLIDGTGQFKEITNLVSPKKSASIEDHALVRAFLEDRGRGGYERPCDGHVWHSEGKGRSGSALTVNHVRAWLSSIHACVPPWVGSYPNGRHGLVF
jgi:hypothetical protein